MTDLPSSAAGGWLGRPCAYVSISHASFGTGFDFSTLHSPDKFGDVAMLYRNRTRPPGSLRDRLLAMAKLARQRAEACPEGPVRDSLLRKADQTERTAAIEQWIGSPGASPPE